MSGTASTTTYYEIPLGSVSETFNVNLGGSNYVLAVQWRTVGDGVWLLDVLDSLRNPIVCGVPLVTGADLLAQYAYLNIPGGLYVITDGDPDAVPTSSNLGSTSHLYFAVTTS